jgi:hypothetical protein
MRRGIRYAPLDPTGMDDIPGGFRCDGYPVVYMPDCMLVAHAMSLPRKRIIVGPSFFLLSGGEQWAVLLHEAGHLQANHFWWRILWVPLCWTKAAERMAQLQELEADHYVIRRGYGVHLMRFFSRALHLPKDDFHPDIAVRYLHAEERMRNVHAIS